MSANFVAGSLEADRQLYTDWGRLHTPKQRIAAAEAGLLIWWGVVLDAVARPSYVANAAERALAFAGDDAVAVVAERWRLTEWRDVDHGSIAMLRYARTRIRSAFVLADSPHRADFWTNAFSNAVYGIRQAGLDRAPETIVPSDVALQITAGGKK